MTRRKEVIAAVVGVMVLVVAGIAGVTIYFLASGGTADVSSWERVESDSFSVDNVDVNMQSVASNGDVTVAVGTAHEQGQDGGSAGVVWWSDDDGTTWNRVNDATFGPYDVGKKLDTVVATASGFAVLGVVEAPDDEKLFFPTAWTSSDGQDWDGADVRWGKDKQSTVEDATEVDGRLVGVGSTAKGARSWDSTDHGATWNPQPHTTSPFTDSPGFTRMEGVTGGDRGVVAVGTESWGKGKEIAAAWTSRDGRTWERVNHDDATFGVPRAATSMTAVAHGNGTYVAVGQSGPDAATEGAAWTSPDGKTWSRVHDDDAFGTGDGPTRIHDVTATEDGFVAVGSAPASNPQDTVTAVWTSEDGKTWERVTDDDGVFGQTDTEAHAVTATEGRRAVIAGATLDRDRLSAAAAWTAD